MYERKEDVEPITFATLNSRDAVKEAAVRILGNDEANSLITVLHCAIYYLSVNIEPSRGDWLIPASLGDVGFYVDDQSEMHLWKSKNLEFVPSAADESATTLWAQVSSLARLVSQAADKKEGVIKTIAAEALIQAIWRRKVAGDASISDTEILALSDLVWSFSGSKKSRRYFELNGVPGGVKKIPARSVCCVLNNSYESHCCPGCPLISDNSERQRSFEKWVSSMTDAEFEETTGYRRR